MGQKWLVGRLKTLALVAATLVLFSACAKRQPNARLGALMAAKDSIERTIVDRKGQIKAAEDSGTCYFKQADSWACKWRSLAREERRLVGEMNALGFGALGKADSLRAELAADSLHLKQKCGEIEAEEKSSR